MNKKLLLFFTILIPSMIYSMEIPPDMASNSDGQTAAHLAILNDDFESLQRLITKDKRLAIVIDNKGHTPLHYAYEVDNEVIIDYLNNYLAFYNLPNGLQYKDHTSKYK